MPIEEMDSRLNAQGIRRLSGYLGGHKTMKFSCSKGHTWDSVCKNVVRGKTGCPICSGKAPLSNAEIDSRLLGRNITRVDEYLGKVASKMKFRCRTCSHEWTAIVTNVLTGSGCPQCCKTGFNELAPAHIYIFSIGGISCGYGISNKIEDRISKHQNSFKKHNAHATLIATYECSGIQAQQIERLIQKTFPIVNTGIDGFKKEATHLHNLPAVLDLINNTLDNHPQPI